jgi:Domain of unknown function (DUF4360)
MKFVKVLLATAVMTVSMTPAFAQQVQIVGARYGGNGCPDGSASVSVSPDGQELTILFDKFVAQGNVSAQARKSCNLSIPIRVPKATKFRSTMLIIAVTWLLAPEEICGQNTFLLAPAALFFLGFSTAKPTITFEIA